MRRKRVHRSGRWQDRHAGSLASTPPLFLTSDNPLQPAMHKTSARTKRNSQTRRIDSPQSTTRGQRSMWSSSEERSASSDVPYGVPVLVDRSGREVFSGKFCKARKGWFAIWRTWRGIAGSVLRWDSVQVPPVWSDADFHNQRHGEFVHAFHLFLDQLFQRFALF